MAEKVTLTPDGLMVAQWNPDTEEQEEELMEATDPTVLSHLRTYCEIDPDTTLWHIMDFVRKSEVLTFLISQYTWCSNIDDFHNELDKPAIIDENDKMDHLEVCWAVDYLKTSNYTNFGMTPEFHGVSLPLTAEDQAAASAESGFEQAVGRIEKYSVSASPLNQFAHLKLVLNAKVEVYRLKKHPKLKNYKLLTSECDFSLLDIIDSIYFDISFHGPPDQRDKFVEELKEQVEELDLGLVELIPMDEVFEDLGISPRTDEDNKEDDETDADEWNIEI
jgi:hypothetical protein